MAIDPVCGMQVNEASAENVSELAGTRYYFCGPGCKRKFDANSQHYLSKPRPEAAQPVGETKATDPVCGMQVDVATAKNISELDGKKYYFCSAGCKAKFDANPDPYLNKPHAGHAHHHAAPRAAGAEVPAEGVIYTCPMHPEVRQIGPGTCPLCGMALEPLL